MMGYRFEVFVSYRREGSVHEWVRQFFYPQLKERLLVQFPTTVAVFFDEVSLPAGARTWPAISQALGATKLLVPVLTPNYFGSDWCKAEYDSIVWRQQQLAIPNDASIMVPVKFSGQRDWPFRPHGISCFDFSSVAYTGEAFKQSPKFLEFESLMMDLVDEITARITAYNYAHDPSWKIFDPTHSGGPESPIGLPKM
jgi:hypothetical protein